MKDLIKYEDNDVLIFFKQPRMLSQKDKTNDLSAVCYVKNYLKEKGIKDDIVLLNRIDRPASGLLIFTKNKRSTNLFSRALRKLKIRKKYLAIVYGKPKQDKATLSGFIKQFENNTSKFFLEEVKGSKECVLEYELIKTDNVYSLLEINLITGRKHQIRASMSFLGTPVVGDSKYFPDDKVLKQKIMNANFLPKGEIALFAYYIGFSHPLKNGKIIEVCLDYPKHWIKIP